MPSRWVLARFGFFNKAYHLNNSYVSISKNLIYICTLGNAGHTAKSNEKKSPVHMVSAWANDNNLVLGQVKVFKKSNEITAIPKLLEVLSIKDTIVTIDAMGCQTAIAEKIIKKQADYILAVKANQKKKYKN